VIDIKFLYGTRQPVVAVLYQDTKEARHFKTYVVLLKDKVRRVACLCSDNTTDPSLVYRHPCPVRHLSSCAGCTKYPSVCK
jgi:hypothetical protein